LRSGRQESRGASSSPAKLIFREEKWYQRMLHNEPRGIQRRLQFEGIQTIVSADPGFGMAQPPPVNLPSLLYIRLPKNAMLWQSSLLPLRPLYENFFAVCGIVRVTACSGNGMCVQSVYLKEVPTATR